MGIIKSFLSWWGIRITNKRPKRRRIATECEKKTLCDTYCNSFGHKKTGHPLTNCKICNKELRLIDRFFCKYCGKWHCKTHRLPENHHCHNPIRPPGLEQPNPGWNKYYD